MEQQVFWFFSVGTSGLILPINMTTIFMVQILRATDLLLYWFIVSNYFSFVVPLPPRKTVNIRAIPQCTGKFKCEPIVYLWLKIEFFMATILKCRSKLSDLLEKIQIYWGFCCEGFSNKTWLFLFITKYRCIPIFQHKI